MDTIEATITWTCVSVEHNEAGDGCENCGAGIKNIFVARSNTGATLRVGSECIQTLVSGSSSAKEIVVIDVLTKRLNRAISQWRKQLPSALPNETREQYINRRVAEMGNAWKAYRALCALPRETFGYSWKRDEKDKRIVERYLRMNGVNDPKFRKSFSDCYTREEKDAYWIDKEIQERYSTLRIELSRDLQEKRHERLTSAFARKYGANPFDFTGRYASQVQKL